MKFHLKGDIERRVQIFVQINSVQNIYRSHVKEKLVDFMNDLVMENAVGIMDFTVHLHMNLHL